MYNSTFRFALQPKQGRQAKRGDFGQVFNTSGKASAVRLPGELSSPRARIFAKYQPKGSSWRSFARMNGQFALQRRSACKAKRWPAHPLWVLNATNCACRRSRWTRQPDERTNEASHDLRSRIRGATSQDKQEGPPFAQQLSHCTTNRSRATDRRVTAFNRCFISSSSEWVPKI